MPATELAFRPDVNVSIATGNGRFSAVDQWPVLGVHRGGCLHMYASWTYWSWFREPLDHLVLVFSARAVLAEQACARGQHSAVIMC
jgi:hypothetical protein